LPKENVARFDPAEGYRNFRGRDPKVEALMKEARI
jgi:Zn-dependent oligopeptidase